MLLSPRTRRPSFATSGLLEEDGLVETSYCGISEAPTSASGELTGA
jgi:hypothetical protein